VQTRIMDKGITYDYKLWRMVFKTLGSPGIGWGMDITPSTTSSSSVSLSAGGLILSTGVVVYESSARTISLGTTFPPSLATNYTIYTEHDETAIGLLCGDSMTYHVTASLLTSNPTNGVVLGWIRHPGGGVSLEQSHIYGAPKVRPLEIVQAYFGTNRICLSPPNLVLTTTTSTYVTATQGWDATNHHAWRGVANSDGGSNRYGKLYMQWNVTGEPYQVSIRNITPGSSAVTMTVYDTNNSSVGAVTFTGNNAWTLDTVTISRSGTWTVGSKATVVLDFTTPAGQIEAGNTLKFAELIVDHWPYGTSRLI